MVKTIYLILIGLFGSMLGGCVAVVGTPEGIRAYGDYQVGTQKTAKESPDSENQYFQMRAKSFWEKLTETPEVK